MAEEYSPNHDGPLVKLLEPFSDARGDLMPLLDDAPLRSALMIQSVAGAVRANHYHYTDWHYLYVVSGRMEYYYRAVDSNEPPTHMTVLPGQMIYTPAMVVHKTDFPEDTLCVTLSGNPRDQVSYEADIVRIEIPIDQVK
jgi:mannose-6-phosphate isomerase-like protein (cupin superfamily)